MPPLNLWKLKIKRAQLLLTSNTQAKCNSFRPAVPWVPRQTLEFSSVFVVATFRIFHYHALENRKIKEQKTSTATTKNKQTNKKKQTKVIFVGFFHFLRVRQKWSKSFPLTWFFYDCLDDTLLTARFKSGIYNGWKYLKPLVFA